MQKRGVTRQDILEAFVDCKSNRLMIGFDNEARRSALGRNGIMVVYCHKSNVIITVYNHKKEYYTNKAKQKKNNHKKQKRGKKNPRT